jgi:PKHD-type hydroxylase
MENLTSLPLRQVPYESFIEVDSVFSPEECSFLIKKIKDNVSISTVDGGFVNKEIRSSKSFFIDRGGEFEWVFERVWHYMRLVNLEFYNFDLACFREGIQFSQYDAGDFYNWHKDYGPLNFSTRKLSGVINLSSPEEYSGGELELFRVLKQPQKSQGNLIVFPSFEQHRVNNIVSGTRYSLTTWISGNCFR